MKLIMLASCEKTIKDVAFSIHLRYPDAEFIPVRTWSDLSENTDLHLSDVMFIDSSVGGAEVVNIMIRNIRKISDAPLIAISDTEDRVENARFLDEGADEYVVKPISPVELLCKIKALLRRINGLSFQEERKIDCGNGLIICLNNREVILNGEKIWLTPNEYKLLSELAKNLGKVVTHHVLLTRVWGEEYSAEVDFLKKYIYRLRNKLEMDPKRPQALLNERGIGYRLVPALSR